MRFDKYYSYPSYVDAFGGWTKMYVLSKKNSTIKRSHKWRDLMKEFLNVMGYSKQYHLRRYSEAGFA